MEQELLTISEHTSPRPDFSGVRVAQRLFSVWCFVDDCLLFHLAVILSVLRFTASDYHWVSSKCSCKYWALQVEIKTD